jgi:hypothetical protein
MCDQDAALDPDIDWQAEAERLSAEVDKWRAFSRMNEKAYKAEVKERQALEGEVERLRREVHGSDEG